jgi:hypothetical protein
LVTLSQTWFECLLNGHWSSTKFTFSRLEIHNWKKRHKGAYYGFFFYIYKWIWIIYCLSDFDEVVIPAYDSIGAYSFPVGPSVRSFNFWLIGWLVYSFVRSSSDCKCNLLDNLCRSYGTLFAYNFNIVILCEHIVRGWSLDTVNSCI